MIMSFPQKGTSELRARSTAPETNKSIVGIAARYANSSSRAALQAAARRPGAGITTQVPSLHADTDPATLEMVSSGRRATAIVRALLRYGPNGSRYRRRARGATGCATLGAHPCDLPNAADLYRKQINLGLDGDPVAATKHERSCGRCLAGRASGSYQTATAALGRIRHPAWSPAEVEVGSGGAFHSVYTAVRPDQGPPLPTGCLAHVI